MRISTKGRYGLRALIDIAVNSETEPVSISSIGERQSVSTSYLEQLISKMKKAGFLDSVRGVNGGYMLARAPEEISIGDVLRTLEDGLTPANCLGDECGSADFCVEKVVWERINESVNAAVDSLWLQDLIQAQKEFQNEVERENCTL
ncbi:MAG: Rrf2 family transcriptional regulator [Eubacteriaceae bacterium]|nr:Rrf2 family transcriptional regulator [Eubacteriaceae bacterium]